MRFLRRMAVPFTDDHGSVRLCMLLSLLVLRVSVAVAAAPAPTPAAYGSEIVEALAAAKGLGSVMVPRQASNLQTFTGALGGIVAPPITNSGNSQRPFEVDGSTFTDFLSAASRSCSNQHNSCADLANSNKNAGFTVGQCDSQQTACNAAAISATATAFQVQVSSDANFDYFCDL